MTLSLSTRRLLRSAILALSLTVGGSALAAPPNVPARQTEIRSVIDNLQIEVANERVVITPRGRRDLVLFAKTSEPQVVAQLRKAFAENRRLSGGYEVVGYARMESTGAYNFSIQKDGETFVANVSPDGRGTRIEIRGTAYDSRGGMKNPLEPLPSKRARFARGTTSR